MDFDFDDLEGDDKDKVREFNSKFIEVLATEEVQKEVASLRESCQTRLQFETERDAKLAPILNPLYAEDKVTLEWVENQNWALKEDDEGIMEQFTKIEQLFSFGGMGPLSLAKGDLIEVTGSDMFQDQAAVVLSFDADVYSVRFFPESFITLKPDNVKQLSSCERLTFILKSVLEHLGSPESIAAMDELRYQCAKKQDFDYGRWAKAQTILKPVCAHYGVDVSWIWEQSEALAAGNDTIAELHESLSKAISFGTLGPLEFDKGDGVNIDCVDVEEEKYLNGKKGLVFNWIAAEGLYEVQVVAGGPAKLKPTCLTKMDDIERMRSIQKQIMDVWATPQSQQALDGMRSRSKDVMQYSKKLPAFVRHVTGPVYGWFGVDKEWFDKMVAANPKDREISGMQRRAQTLASFGKIGPWGLEKGTYYEAYGLKGGEVHLNGKTFLIRSWDDAKGCYDVSPLEDLGEILSVLAENLKPIPDKTFGSKAEAQAFQEALLKAYTDAAAEQALAALKSAKPNLREYFASLGQQLLTFQKPVLKDFGFRPDPVGQNHMQRALAAFEADTEIAQRTLGIEKHGQQDLRFDGKVAIVTGGGRGLGRAYAKLLAARGAKVVVNNRTAQKADEVVAEITAMGGTAVPEYSDLAVSADNLVPTAINHFGKVDILICNAGQLDDHRFEMMKIEYFTNLMHTHVFGHFNVLKAVWPHMVGQKYGRIVVMSSESGLHGNWGQSNYGAAKMALASMAQTLAMEGFNDNIHVNVVCPVGLTRMTNDLRPMAFRAPEWELNGVQQPSDKAVVYLCHEVCKTTAGIFRAEEGLIQAFRWQADEAFVGFEAESTNALEAIATQWTEWAKWEHVSYPGHSFHMSYRPGGKALFEPVFAGSKAERSKQGDKLSYEGRSAIVTGGGTGMGRRYALFLASRGAKVMVNGTGKEDVNKVVAEITAQGGTALANYTDIVEAGEELVTTCSDTFGTVDIVVCSLGLNWEGPSFSENNFEKFSSVMYTTLVGHTKVLQAAWSEMFMRRFGRIVFITTEAGLWGGAGHLNAGAGSGTYIGMSQTLAMEGHKYGIYCNVIAADEEPGASAQPGVAPVAFLCHENCKATGAIYRVKRGKVQALRWQADEAFVEFDPDEGDAALENVVSQWVDVPKWQKVSYPGMLIHGSYRAH